MMLKRGTLVMVRNDESEDWIFAYLSHFDDNQNIRVIKDGATQLTERTDHGAGEQRHQIDDEDFEWMGGYEFAFQSTEYKQWRLPPEGIIQKVQALEHKQKGLFPTVISNITVENMKRGDLVQVKYSENQPWVFAYFDRFWDDGRIQVIPRGCTIFTETNTFGEQRHQVTDSSEHIGFPHVTYNFWRLPQEITDSGDLRNTDQYNKHWG